MVTEYLDYLWELGKLPVYILVVLALHGSQVAMVWPLPVPGDEDVLRALDVNAFQHGFLHYAPCCQPCDLSLGGRIIILFIL